MWQKEFIRHLLFWILFLFLWSAHDLAYHNNFWGLLQGNLYTIWPYVPLVYFNLFFLVPRYLLKKKHLVYISILTPLIVLTMLITSFNSFWYYSAFVKHMETAEFFWNWEGRITILTEILVLVGLTMTLFLLQQWYQKERYAREMEQKRLETELNLLKSQVNPHFLFNSLNSIYVMLGKDTAAGRSMLLQFSDILSHQLYETSKEKVPLKKEVDNLKNYIKIEKRRHEDLAEVQWQGTESINGELIAPMLLLPIVENAFKHGQSSEGYWIEVRVDINEEKEFSFNVKNSYKAPKDPTQKGIGLANVKRRLELIYPDNHQLMVRKGKNLFEVDLTLKL